MTKKQIKGRLDECKLQETAFNKEMGKMDKTIRECMKRKVKLATLISKNMNYRNQLINKLSQTQ